MAKKKTHDFKGANTGNYTKNEGKSRVKRTKNTMQEGVCGVWSNLLRVGLLDLYFINYVGTDAQPENSGTRDHHYSSVKPFLW